MKWKKILIGIIIFLILFVAVILVYKFTTNNNDDYNFTEISLGNKRVISEQESGTDKDKYKDDIIEEDLLSVKYNFYDDESITGNIYISEDKMLYINDANEGTAFRVSTIKFKSIYYNGYDYEGRLFFYLLSLDGKLYYFNLSSNNIEKSEVLQVDFPLKILNFVDLEFNEDLHKSSNTIFVLAEDGNIYDVISNIRYSDDIKSLYNTLYIYGDNVITNINGNTVVDENGDYLKIKYIFLTTEDYDFTNESNLIIITENDKLLYLYDNPESVFVYKSNVKDVTYDKTFPYEEGNLKITFDDGYEVDFKAECNEYYCVNEFVY